jgi:nickel/cobalt transporter (NicO) family protein
VSPGGPSLSPLAISDAQRIEGLATTAPSAPAIPSPAASTGPGVPGGVGDIPAVFSAVDLSPAIVLVALGTAAVLGAAHALTPGHGKTLMAAYLVGARGTPVHAVGLGLSVTLAHTIGILALATLVVASQAALPADVVVRWLPAIAALMITVLGGWMIVTQVTRRARARAGHGHAEDPGAAEHAHDGVTHVHAPPGATITWRSLFVLGLVGGIVPSASALLILLATIAAGRAAFGVILVVAFGLGMAIVMSGVGLALIFARGRLDALPSSPLIKRASGFGPLAAGIVVLILGVWLTVQAFAARPSL